MAINIKPQNVGKLHKALGITQGSPIPSGRLTKAIKSGSPSVKKEAQFAENARQFSHKGAGSTVGKVAKTPKITSINTDRGSFGMK